MDTKNGLIQNFVLQHQAQPLCAKFSTKSHIMVSGDNKNVITLWRLDKEFPITTLTASQGISNQHGNEITSVCFAPSQHEIFSGSNTGYFCMWDIRTRALNFSCKEHSSFISCIKSSNSDDFQNFVLTGSDDSTIKGWDLREKKSIASYNEHSAKINCIEFSPDGQIFVTGSDDYQLKIWDIRTRKCLQTFTSHKQAITCAIFNPFEIALASTSADGTFNYWDLENFELMYSVTVEENSIQKATFDSNGEYVFTGTNNTLRVIFSYDAKLWHVNSENLQLVDKIEIGWDGIQDLEIQVNSKTGKEILVGVGITPSTFSLWGRPIDELNKNIENIIAQYDNLQSYNIEEENPIPNELMTAQILKKNLSSPFHDKSLDDQMKEEFPVQIPISNDGKMEIEEENGIKKGKTMQVSPYSQRLSGDENPASMNEIDPSQQNLDNEKQSSQQNVPDNASKMELEENLPLNELLESTISLRNVGNASMLSVSYFNLGAKEEHKKELETISELAKEHSIFYSKLSERAKKIRNITSKWKSSFAFETVPAIENLDKNEAPMIMSLITASVVAYKIEKVPLEVVCALLRKALLLLETKFSDFDLYVKVGLGFISTVFQAFSKDIVPNVAQTPKKGVVVKGEVPKKFIKLVEVFEFISHHEILKEIANFDKTQMGKNAKKILSDLDSLFTKIKPSDSNKPKKKV